jgi:drug/metabolite transporter (DMT)-like permease
LPFIAFLFIFVGAFAHSTWNLLAKRAAYCRHLIWFSSVGQSILFLPLAVWILKQSQSRFGAKAAVFLLATGVLHVFYTSALQRGYRSGDLSVVYPLARGTGPLFSFIGAVLVLGERPSLLAGFGALLVSCGILLLSGGTSAFRNRAAHAGLFWGVLTGLIIASYTLTDGYSIRVLLLSPVVVDYAGNLFRTLVLSVHAWRERAAIPREYRQYWREALGISILTPVAYMLALFAMRLAPVSRVAPAREMSMVIGAYWGSKLLKEGYATRRILGSALVAAGVAALTLG